jgi:hypothetical protein
MASEAVSDAIKSAILQVNGTTVDIHSTQFDGAIGISVGRKEIELQSSGFAQLVSQNSRGAVTGFRIVSIAKSDAEQQYVAVIDASIAKFRPPEDSKKLKIVVAPLRLRSTTYQIGDDNVPAGKVGEQMRQAIINELSQSGRFSVLDREFTGEVTQELELVSSGQAPTAEFGKLGQTLSADLIWVGTIDSLGYQKHSRNLATSDRPLVSYSGGVTLSHRLINVATRQIVFSDTVDISVAPLGPTTLGLNVNTEEKLANLEASLSSGVVPVIVMRMFPVTIVSKNGSAVVLSQGGKSLREHASYQVVLMGDEIRDPQTGLSLGRTERPCCVVDVDRVTPTLSYGTLRDISADLDRVGLGGLEVRQMRENQQPVPRAAALPLTTGVHIGSNEPAVQATSTAPKPGPLDSEAAPESKKDNNW